MDQLSNKNLISLLLVALVVTVIGTLISVNQLSGTNFGTFTGAAVTNTITPTEDQELSSNVLHQKAPNQLVVLVKNDFLEQQDVQVIAQLFSGEEIIISVESDTLRLDPGRTDQLELKLDLREAELGEYTLKLYTYYNQVELQQKEMKVYLIK
ncbi:MAG: hypothetical protein WCV90_02485 [Candidatus Woesearchaeota archaeon]